MDRLDRQVSLYCLCCISKYFSLERASYNAIYLCQPHKHRIHVWSQRWVPETGRLLRQGPVSAFQLGWQNPALRYFHTCSRLGGMPKNIACILFFVLICWYMCVQINYCHNNVEQTINISVTCKIFFSLRMELRLSECLLSLCVMGLTVGSFLAEEAAATWSIFSLHWWQKPRKQYQPHKPVLSLCFQLSANIAVSKASYMSEPPVKG